MTVQVVVTGIGLVSALGSLEMTWKQLLLGRSGIQHHQPFPELQPLPLALISQQPAGLIALTQQAVTEALQDARLTPPLPDCGVVIGSSRGNQAKLEQLARKIRPDRAVSEDPDRVQLCQFPDFLPHVAAIATARFLGSTGVVLAPTAACATGILAIAQGFELIKTGQCQRVIVGAIETPITPLTLAGFNRMGALSPTGAYPFDRQRDGFVLGEGGAIFVLETAPLAKHRQARIYGEILGFGITNDADSLTAPNAKGKSALIAVRQSLERSHLSPKDIDFIHAHGTGTLLNDRHEAQLIQSLFPNQTLVSSTKGATGHTLGASGALGVAFALMSLSYQILPPCTGLKTPEFDDLNLVRKTTGKEVRNALCFSFGFGGQNAILALGNFDGNLPRTQ